MSDAAVEAGRETGEGQEPRPGVLAGPQVSHRGDAAPGDEPGSGSGVAVGLRGYLIGFGLATGLTVASFGLAASQHLVYGPALPIALLTLAVAQMGIHLVFFLHITTGPDNTNNVLALAFGILIVCLVVFGTIWIMNHLNTTMMPMDKLMEMQR